MAARPRELIAQADSACGSTGFHEIPQVTRVEKHGLLASVMSSFEVRLSRNDEKPLVRGLNRFQLLNDGERWWIVFNIGVVETAAAPLPAEFLPADGRKPAQKVAR